MLKMSMIEFFVRLIPEVLLFILSAHAFSKVKIDYKRYIESSLLFVITALVIRFSPINYGVHTILNIIASTIIVALVNKIDIISSIKASIMSAITLFICEGINIILLVSFIGVDLNPIMNNTILKTIYCLPSLICFMAFVVTYYKYLNKKGKLKNV